MARPLDQLCQSLQEKSWTVTLDPLHKPSHTSFGKSDNSCEIHIYQGVGYCLKEVVLQFSWHSATASDHPQVQNGFRTVPSFPCIYFGHPSFILRHLV